MSRAHLVTAKQDSTSSLKVVNCISMKDVRPNELSRPAPELFARLYTSI